MNLRTREELQEQVRKQMSLKWRKKLGFPLFAEQESTVCYPNTTPSYFVNRKSITKRMNLMKTNDTEDYVIFKRYC